MMSNSCGRVATDNGGDCSGGGGSTKDYQFYVGMVFDGDLQYVICGLKQ